MSDSYNIQEIGGAELAQHYPDRGLIPESNWYNASLKVETRAEGWWRWLESFARGTQTFGAILSANGEGLRILVLLDRFTTFLPWSEVSMSAERMWSATVLRLCPAAVPSLTLVFHLDDEAAEDLLRHTAVQLPPRIPPRRLPWNRDHPWLVGLVFFSVMIVVLFAWSLVRGN